MKCKNIKGGNNKMNIETLLNERIVTLFEELKDKGLNDKERESITNELNKLLDKATDINRLHMQNDEIEIKRDEIEVKRDEIEIKRNQLKGDKIDRVVKNGIAIGGIIIPVAAAGYWTILSFAFEKEDTLTSTAGRKHLNWLLSMIKK